MSIEELKLILQTFESVTGNAIIGVGLYMFIQSVAPLAKISVVCYTVFRLAKLFTDKLKVNDE